MQALRKRFAVGRKHVRTIVDIAIILAVTIVVFRNFIFSPQWPAGGDVLGYLSREYIYWKDCKWLFVWRPNSFGYPEGINLMDFFYMLLHFVTQDAANTAKIFALSSFALAGFTMYSFGYHCTKRNLAALAGSLIYMLNGQFLTQLTEAHLDIMLSYAVAPVIFLFLDKALDTGNMKDIVASSILFGIMLTCFHPEMIIIYGIFLGLFVIINLLRFRNKIKLHLKTLISICALATVLSACFWMPILFNARAPYFSTTFSRGNLEDTYGLGYKTIDEAFTLSGKEGWGYVNIVDVTKGVSLQILPVPAILVVVFAFAYIITFVFRLNRYSLFFGLCAVISIIVSMGPYSLFASAFIWAWSNVPYFQVFRAISRWNSMTAFSNAFFVSVSVSILTGYIAKVSSTPNKESEVTKNSIHENPGNHLDRTRNPKVPKAGFRRISHFARSFLSTRARARYVAIFALVVILMSGFISTWFLFDRGLQVYTPPSDYIQPYEYMDLISGMYKIVAVGRSDWYSDSSQNLDFVGGMLTPIGWSHDIGYESTFIHDKPVLQDGGLSPASTDFVNYLRFYLAKNNITRNLLKMLGAFNYKYVVIPPYITQDLRAFFTSQYGGHSIYNQSGSIILENDFYTPRIFGPTQSVLVLGGVESLSSMYSINSFDLSKTAVVLADQADNFATTVNNRLNDTAAIVFADTDAFDLMMMPSSNVHVIDLAGFGILSSNAQEYWIRNDWWTNIGASILGRWVLTTGGRNEIHIPIELNSGGDYDIWIRVAFAPGRGKLHVSMDGLSLADIIPHSEFSSGLRWINLTSNLHLETGSHSITLLNDGTGYNDLDAIAVVEHSKLASQTEHTFDALRGFTGKILYMIEAEKAFSYTLPERWFITTIPSEGYALHMEGGGNVSSQASTSILVPRKGEYNFAARLFSDNESNGTFYLKVDERLYSISCSANESKGTWFELGSASLDIGKHNLDIFASGNVTLDKIGIYSTSLGESGINDIFGSDPSGPSVSCEEVNPCRYIAHVNCTQPFLLVFSESYHPLWKAYVDNNEISPMIVDSIANGFFINKTGSFDVTLYFTGQEGANIGLVISGSGTILVVSVVSAKSAPAKRVKRFILNRLLKRSLIGNEK